MITMFLRNIHKLLKSTNSPKKTNVPDWSFDEKVVILIIAFVGFLVLIWILSSPRIIDAGKIAAVLGFVAIFRTIKYIMQKRKEEKGLKADQYMKETGKLCPTCGNSNVRSAYIEDGGMGDWCPNCKMSLKKMQGLL
jgi:ssDNA-binding Zn-finger/Zn-ribbon topoisomerase 1